MLNVDIMKTITILLATLLLAVSQGALAQTKLETLQKERMTELKQIEKEKRNLTMAENTLKMRQINPYGLTYHDYVLTETGWRSVEDLLDIRGERMQRRQFELQRREDEIKIQLEALQMRQDNVERFKQTMLLTAQQMQEDVVIKKLLVALQK